MSRQTGSTRTGRSRAHIGPALRQIISPANLAYTRTPKVAISDKAFYALGWIVQLTPDGDIVFHTGITNGFAAIVALQLDRKVGVIVLSNQAGFGMPGEAIGL